MFPLYRFPVFGRRSLFSMGQTAIDSTKTGTAPVLTKTELGRLASNYRDPLSLERYVFSSLPRNRSLIKLQLLLVSLITFLMTGYRDYFWLYVATGDSLFSYTGLPVFREWVPSETAAPFTPKTLCPCSKVLQPVSRAGRQPF